MVEKIIDRELAGMVFGDNEAMYRKYLFQFVERDLMGSTQTQIENGELDKAFETAHTMKGLVQNLALTDFAAALDPVVESLRKGLAPSDEHSDALKDKYNEIIEVINYVKENDVKLL